MSFLTKSLVQLMVVTCILAMLTFGASPVWAQSCTIVTNCDRDGDCFILNNKEAGEVRVTSRRTT